MSGYLAGCLGLAALVATSGLAAQPVSVISLEYSAGTSCPDSREFQRLLRGHSDVRVGASGLEPVRVRVTIEQETEVVGRIAWSEGSSTPAAREVRAPDCRSVAAALALILALALDPDGLELPRSADPPKPEQRAALRPVESPVDPWRFSAGALLGLTGGVAPEAAPAAGVFFEASRGQSGFRPTLRLAALVASASAETNAGDADFGWQALRVGASVWALGTPEPWLEPVATFDLGRLLGRGRGLDRSETGAALWYGPGAGIFAGAWLFHALTLGLDAGATFPLARDSFSIRPDAEVHRIPAVAGHVLLAIGVRR
ncbi:MAG: hypothetical protein U0263_29150 [Polyangiaceae bacterium]